MSTKKLYRCYSGPGDLLGIIAAENEQLVWAWGHGAKLPIHRVEEVDVDLSPTGLCIIAEAQELDHDDVDRLKKRWMKGTKLFAILKW